jgi:serine/threonine protein kinase/WD40 repeat protein
VTGWRVPDDWTRIAALVDALLDTPPPERAARIEELSAGNPARRAELERLLMECEHGLTLLDRPAAEQFASLLDGELARFPDALAERYRPTREVGHGGMAAVYLAHDLKHDRDVAIKVVHPAVATALGAGRFLREIAIVAQLRHPHIVPLYDSGEADGALYFVMPYEPGASLRDRLAREGALPVEDVVILLRDVCDALAHAHRAGIVHLDVKPDNVLLSERHALVTDFGIARSGEKGAAGVEVALGTPAYMAPEQIAGERVIDGRADIYSVGALAYELLTGRPPLTGADRDAVFSAHLNERPIDVGTLRPDIPAPLAELVMRCLQKSADDRWQSADELVARLETMPTSSALARRRWVVPAALASVVIVGVLAVAMLTRDRHEASVSTWRSRWANARIERLTDFPGSEVDASISADGRLVAFLADRDSVFDAFVTTVGTERFTNLTDGRLPQLFNEDVRNVGFTAGAADVWLRVADIASPASVSLIPVRGGALRPFLKTAVMAVWSPDGSKIAYHETVPGDPIWVADRAGRHARRVFIAEPGVHCHHLSWSPDGRLIYFVMGLPPNEMDVWRVPSDGGPAERITHHQSRVANPTPLDDRTIVYTATADDGTGPWLYTMDLMDRTPRRVSTGIEHYLSVAASSSTESGVRRLVATVSNPSAQLWSAPIGGVVAGEQDLHMIRLPTARTAAPRFSPDSTLFYLASRGGADGLWRLTGSVATEVWKPTYGAVVGAASVSPDGRRICFPVHRTGRSMLFCTAPDGSGAHVLAESLDVRGAPSWSPDGKWLAVAARAGRGLRVFKVPANGGAPVRLVDSVSSNPVWSPDGSFILYSGTARARSVPVKAVSPDGRPHPFPPLTVDRVGDSYRFLPSGKQIVVKLGGFRQQDFWLFDAATGAKRRLTALHPGESLQRFDVSPDGTHIAFERVRENSDIVLIELPE